MKIDFMIAGVQKSGTSALDRYLRLHKQIAMAEVKETHFFDNEDNFIDSVDYSRYHRFFTMDSGKKKGEATPIYTYWYTAPQRIWQYNPEMKLIIVLRNPVDRAYSHWNMERNRNADALSFSEAIRTESMRCRSALPLQHRVYSYVDRGFYSEQLRRIWHFFPRRQTFVIKFDDLKNKPAEVLAEVALFLEIAPFDDIQYLDTHSIPYPAPMTAEDRAWLQEIFRLEIRNLEKLLQWDCSSWLE